MALPPRAISFAFLVALSTGLITACKSSLPEVRAQEATPESAPEPLPEKSLNIDGSKESFYAAGRSTVDRNARIQPDRRKARNVILFVGDGMGVTTVTAARILDGQQKGLKGEENELSFEKFPYLAHSKTYQANQQVPDSAPTMTAIVTGCKTNDGMLSIAPNVIGNDFASAIKPENKLRTILEAAEERGLWTGVVSTARLTHATPGACYAHTPARDYESDADIDNDRLFKPPSKASAHAVKYLDIARQLIDFKIKPTDMNGHPSNGLELAMGGGRAKFLSAEEQDPEYPDKKGQRKDRSLVEIWSKRGGAYVYDRAGFEAIDPKKTGPVLGLFEPDHMQYELDRALEPESEPSLEEMTEKAIEILQNGPSGFFLMVEAGRIDHAHHAGNAARALQDAVELSRAVERAVELAGKDSLILVTADHSHVLTMAGYPVRGNPILGLVVTNDSETGLTESTPSKAKDGKPYTTLGYMNGPGAIAGERADLSTVDTEDPNFKQQALVSMVSETHGGEDVPIYAQGPHAFLVQGTMEQNAIFWVMARALGIEIP